VETWATAELGTRGTIERVPVGHSHLRLRAPYFYPTVAADKAIVQWVKVPPCQLPESGT
jgi:hypothetical protein